MGPSGQTAVTPLSFPDLIAKKRDGGTLTEGDIQRLVDGVVSGDMEPTQIGAMLMAIVLRGMDDTETGLLTRQMMLSGEILTWPEAWRGSVVDKHSTGGVGDKVSLPLAPALAACGLKVPMISGRGLGHTGGTLDKLESIPGYQVQQSVQDMRHILETVGCCIVGQTASLVPADKVLYGIRDVTGTVASIPLIAASIISKKGAEGPSALVLDVKSGKGAFLTEEKDARTLAQTMVACGKALGIKTTAVLTSMNAPIGLAVGNALEVVESVRCLQGLGPEDLTELCATQGGILLHNMDKVESQAEGAAWIRRVLQDGSALQRFQDMLEAQGVAAPVAKALCARDRDPFETVPRARHHTELAVTKDGLVVGLDAMTCAHVSCGLGAGRTKVGEPVDHAVGLQLHIQVGAKVKAGDTWVTVHHNSELRDDVIKQLQSALLVAPPTNERQSLIIDVIY